MEKQRANFHQDYSVLFNPQNTTQWYGIKYAVLNAENMVEKVLHYEMKTETKRISPEVFSIRFFKENVRLDYKQPSLIVEKLSSHVVSALFPINIHVNNRLEWVKGITNHNEIVGRWKDEKREIDKKMKSATTDTFCKKVDRYLGSKTMIENKINQDWFFALFFHPIYLRYTATLKQESDFYAPLLPYRSAVVYKGILQPNEFKTQYNTIQIRYEGYSHDDRIRLYHKTLFNKGLNSPLSMVYEIDNITHMIKNIRVVCKIIEQQSKMVLKTIQYNVYALNQKENTPKHTKNKMQFFIEEKPLKK